jgi:hypothetical protein
MTFASAGPRVAAAEGQHDFGRLFFRCRAATVNASSRIAGRIDAWMLESRGRRFAWDGGQTGPAFRAHWDKGTEPALGRGGDSVYYDLLTYRLAVKGQR